MTVHGAFLCMLLQAKQSQFLIRQFPTKSTICSHSCTLRGKAYQTVINSHCPGNRHITRERLRFFLTCLLRYGKVKFKIVRFNKYDRYRPYENYLFLFRDEDEITSPGRRTDSGQVCSIYKHKSCRNSELFQDFCTFRPDKVGLKL